MSLQVWLPFTDGTLKQQGIKNVSATAVGTVGLTGNGKLGKCATFNGGGGITLPSSTMTSFTECSVAFWINITAWNTSWDTIFQAGLNSTPWNHYIFGILRSQGNYLCFTVSNGSNSTQGGYASSNLTVGEWIHLVFTYGDGKCKIYINGMLDKEYSASITPKFTDITNIAIGRSTNGSNYQSKCKLNDFRIYDHCLSPMEVKQISQGLVLHYPLDNNGWGQENLIITNSMAPTSGTSGWSSAGNGWVNSNVISTGASSGHAIRCTYSGTTQISGGIHHPTGVDKTALTDGATYTLSARIRASKSCIASFHNELMTTSNSINLTTEWKIYSYSCAIDTSKTYHSNVIYCRAADATQDMWIECDWIKLEEGSVATPWCPNSSDALATTMGLNDNIEYDTSGFCNNGTRTGTFSWTSDTPKYNASIGITAGGGIFTPMNITFSQYTIAFWAKHTAGSKMLMGSCPSAGATQNSWYWYGDNSFKYPSGEYYYTYNGGAKDSFKWTHFVATYDGANVRVYRNGVSEGSKACTGDQAMAYLSVGYGLSSNYTENSNMSDFRIYTTTLSADDVKSLYQNSAYIDSSGNVYGAVHLEA